jgi:hypothetical protein
VKRGSIRRIPIVLVSLHVDVSNHQIEDGMSLITASEELYWQDNRLKKYWRCKSRQQTDIDFNTTRCWDLQTQAIFSLMPRVRIYHRSRKDRDTQVLLTVEQTSAHLRYVVIIQYSLISPNPSSKNPTQQTLMYPAQIASHLVHCNRHLQDKMGI